MENPENVMEEGIQPAEEENVPPLQDDEEKRHFLKVVNAFRSYRTFLGLKFDINKATLANLPARQQEYLTNYKKNLEELEKCVDKNQILIDIIMQDVDKIFENIQPLDVGCAIQECPSAMDLEKVQSTLKQFVRDWSKEGAEERKECYEPIIGEIIKNFPPEKCCAEEIKVLVPGAGLGRLAFEIANKGYCCQGNEVSLFMLFASNFILNKCYGVNVYSVYPWVHQVDNNITAEQQMEKVFFPDVDPRVLRHSTKFSMAAGDFLEIYPEDNTWNCVSTCFFIDCASNIVDYIERIYSILTPDGIWINMGPLLYHFSNMPDTPSIEPSYSVVKEVIIAVGFIIEREEINVRTRYSQNPHSMLQSEYRSVFFVCRKPA